MSYTITNNAQFNSIEILFDAKPSEAVRSALKSLKFRWHNQRGIWYGYRSEAEVREAIENACPELINNEAAQVGPVWTVEKVEHGFLAVLSVSGGDAVMGRDIKEQARFDTEEEARAYIDRRSGKAEQTKAPKAAKVDRDMLRGEFAKAWNSQRMIDYCVNKVAAVAELPCGELITVDKQSIETRFCFGESGYDFDDAVKAAAHARTSCEYFKAENMKAYRDMIKTLEEAKTMEGQQVATLPKRGHYNGQAADCRLRFVEWKRLSEVLGDLGGSAFLADLPGKTIKEGEYWEYKILTADEIDIIINAWKQAAAAHEKKVDAYLKRYGTSKVHAWTYWRDA